MIESQTKKSILISLLWLLLSTAYWYALLILLLATNLFSWSPRLDIPTISAILAILLLIIALYYTAKFTKDKIDTIVSLLTSLALFAIGIYVLFNLYNETVSSGFFSRTILSPHWFRWSLFSLYLMPSICWLIYPFKVLKKSRSVIK